MRKKLFAILMSAMMMVTFMPAMAFAAVTPVGSTHVFKATKWAADYSTVTGTIDADAANTVTLPTVRTFDTTNGWITAVPKVSAYQGLGYDNAEAINTRIYYDLNSVTLGGNFAYSIFTKDQFDGASGLFPTPATEAALNLPANSKLVFNAPTYVDNYADLTSSTKVVTGKNLVGYKAFMKKPAYDTTSFAKQEFKSVEVNVEKRGAAVDWTTSNPDVIGVVPAKDITVQARVPGFADVAFYFDTVSDDTEITDTLYYDGAEHTVITNELPNTTISYEVFNAKTGKWEAVDKVTLKDVKDAVKFRADVKVGTTDYGYKNASGTLVSVTRTQIDGFEFDVNDVKGGDTFNVGENYNPADYIIVDYTGKTQKAAVEANNALLKEYFNDFFEIKLEPKKYDETIVDATLVGKKIEKADQKAMTEKYGQLVKNFGETLTFDGVAPALMGSNNDATFVLTGGDIEWVKAPLTKTYHNKKGALKKTHTFTVKAKASSTVTYTLENGGSMIKINKTTGKVTVKKGLKKGTYKVKVTAVAGGMPAAYTLTVKVVK